MNSPSHKRNVLDSRFTEIGIAAANGYYNGSEAIFVVQFFGSPSKEAISQPSIRIQIAGSQARTPVDAPVSEEFLPEPSPSPTAIFLPQAPQVLTVARSERIDLAASQVLSNPRKTLNTIMIYIVLAVMLAMMLTIFVHKEIRQPQAIANGLVVALVVLGFIVINTFLGGLLPQIA
jgi:hypothetical protein